MRLGRLVPLTFVRVSYQHLQSNVECAGCYSYVSSHSRLVKSSERVACHSYFVAGGVVDLDCHQLS